MEQKIDRRRNYLLVIDTETAPANKDLTEVTPSNMFVYDVGFAVVDKHGTVYETASFVNADVFFGEKSLMKSAYYAEKIPRYWEDIKSGTRTLVSWYKIVKTVHDVIKKYNIQLVFAHNMRFDYGSTNNTQRWLTKSKYRYFFPYGVTICDTLKMSQDILKNKPTYRRFCEENGFMTKHKTPRPQMKAEVIYKFITGNLDFVESHTGLEDVMIEKEILAYCYRQHKPMRKELWGNK